MKRLVFMIFVYALIKQRMDLLTMNASRETKHCSKCKKDFLVSTHFQSRLKTGTKYCKLCRDQNNKCRNNPTSARSKRQKIYLSHKRNQTEKSRGCQWIGCRFNFSDEPETFIVCENVQNIVIFEFDHITPQEKLFHVSHWYNSKKTEQELIDEISKCRILCSFHHHIHSQNQRTEKKKNKSDYSNRIATVQLRKRNRENYDKLNELKLDIGKCEICKRIVLERETSGFDFDHIDQTEKHHAISKMVSFGYSWENTILPEIDKCRLLCANCHRIHTQEQNMQSKNENVTIVSRKRKRYQLPRNKEELEIRDKGERPTKDELYALVLKYTFVDVGKPYGVTDQTIINWCKKEKIPHTRRQLMEISNET